MSRGMTDEERAVRYERKAAERAAASARRRAEFPDEAAKILDYLEEIAPAVNAFNVPEIQQGAFLALVAAYAGAAGRHATGRIPSPAPETAADRHRRQRPRPEGDDDVPGA